MQHLLSDVDFAMYLLNNFLSRSITNYIEKMTIVKYKCLECGASFEEELSDGESYDSCPNCDSPYLESYETEV